MTWQLRGVELQYGGRPIARHIGTFDAGEEIRFDAWPGEVVTVTIIGDIPGILSQTIRGRTRPSRKAWLDPYPGRRR